MEDKEKTVSKDTRRRVKIYQLDPKNQWDDRGTGHVLCMFVEKQQAMCLLVYSEKDPESLLLETKICSEDIYQLQQDTLIVWNEPETDIDLALSFQESVGCKEIYEQILQAQKGMSRSSPENVDEVGEVGSSGSLLQENNGSSITISSSTSFNGGSNNTTELPPPTLNNLSKILEILMKTQASASPAFKEKIVSSLVKEDYNFLVKLIDLFKMSEDIENGEILHTFYSIFKTLILINDTSLYDLLFSDDFIMDLMGALEYDPELPSPVLHRKFLSKQVVFKEVVPFQNKDIIAKIHQTYRIQYLKDVVLPRILDDPTFATLNSIIYFNNVEIVSHIQNDSNFLSQLFKQLKLRATEEVEIANKNTSSGANENSKKQGNSSELNDSHLNGKTEIENNQLTVQTQIGGNLKDLISLLQDLCNLAKNLQAQSRVSFYQALTKHGLCEILEGCLAHSELSIRLSTVNILESILVFDVVGLRKFLVSQKPRCELFNQLLKTFLHDNEMGITIQMTDILRSLIDVGDEAPDRNEFSTLFYNQFIQKLIDPISSSEISDTVKENITNLLSYCVQHHGYLSRTTMIGSNVISKVVKLIPKHKEKHLLLGIIRFVRSIVGMKDDFYNRHITKNNLLEPVVLLFKENKTKYNLINSAILELFEYIRKENIKMLIQYLVEHFESVFHDVEYVETFKQLLLRYQQNQEALQSPGSTSTLSASSTSTPVLSASQNSIGRERDFEEEAYFEDEEIDISSTDPIDSTLSRDSLPNDKEYVPPILAAVEDLGQFKPRRKSIDEEEESIPFFPVSKSSTTSNANSSESVTLRSPKRKDSDEDIFAPSTSKKAKININISSAFSLPSNTSFTDSTSAPSSPSISTPLSQLSVSQHNDHPEEKSQPPAKSGQERQKN